MCDHFLGTREIFRQRYTASDQLLWLKRSVPVRLQDFIRFVLGDVSLHMSACMFLDGLVPSRTLSHLSPAKRFRIDDQLTGMFLLGAPFLVNLTP